MNHIISLCLCASVFNLSAAVPLHWTVETSRLAPAVFDVVRGETIALEAAFNSSGKPFAMDGEPVSIFWQTNGMGNAWWTAPAVATSNLVRATFTPEMDPGAATVNGFLGSSGSIYRAAFTFRFRHGPGAVPNTLPLPVPVIDFAKVTVLNPPWSSGGVDTNAVRDIVGEYLATNGIRSVDGAARPLPKYLHALDFDDTYPEDAAWYYAQPQDYGSCSAVREGGFLYRNYDWKFDDAAEFVVRMSAAEGRFASVGVANCGTNLTESLVTSGKWSRYYKCLPGRVVDGINENGVVAEVNVVDGEPQWGEGVSPALHPLAAVRWTLDNATNAAHAAAYLASHIAFPAGWTQNFHWMIADERETWIVENGTNYLVGAGASRPRVALTNFRLYPTRDTIGEGQERYDALAAGASITSQWWTLTYTDAGYRASDLPGITGEDLTNLFNYWENNPRESHRGETFGGKVWWQTIHTSVYDISNRTLRVAVQETDDWYTFAVPSAGGVKPEAVREIVEPMIGTATNGLRRVEDLAVYDSVITNWVAHGLPEGVTLIGQPHWEEDHFEWDAEGGHLFFCSDFSKEKRSGYFFGEDGDFGATFSLVQCPTSDRLATTNGVAEAIADKADKSELPDPGFIKGWVASADYATSAADATTANYVLWSGVEGKPTTLSGYGITDAYTKTETEQKIVELAPAPGDYAAVSNAAMNAIQAVTNADANLIYTITSDGAEPRFYFTPVGAINAED